MKQRIGNESLYKRHKYLLRRTQDYMLDIIKEEMWLLKDLIIRVKKEFEVVWKRREIQHFFQYQPNSYQFGENKEEAEVKTTGKDTESTGEYFRHWQAT